LLVVEVRAVEIVHRLRAELVV
jgi:hypothetical protein